MAYGENPNNQHHDNRNSGGGFLIARVKDIVLGPVKDSVRNILDPNFTGYGDIGKIRFEILYSPDRSSLANLSDFAYPYNYGAIKHLPLNGEIVYIIQGPSPGLNDDAQNKRLYYMPPFPIWNAVNHNVFPNLDEYAQFNSQQKSKPGYNRSSTANNSVIEFPKGYSFQENPAIRSLYPFEGDTILESRFGSSIRFGSTTNSMKNLNNWSSVGSNGAPILIIRNGQGSPSNPSDPYSSTVEDINTDASSIYLTNGQKIVISSLLTGEYPLNSFEKVNVVLQQQNVLNVSVSQITSNETVDAASQDSNVLQNLVTNNSQQP
jgi:hypothetical protein